MSQILATEFGVLEVVQSWSDAKTTAHIVKLANGAYAHHTGLPIKDKQELIDAIHNEKELQEALQWFESKDDEQPKRRGFKLHPDGNWTFDDGTQIMSLSDILANTTPGPAQDAMFIWWKAKEAEKEGHEKLKRTPVGQAAVKAIQNMAKPAKEQSDDKAVKGNDEEIL